MVTNKVGKQGAVGQVPKRLFHLNVQLFTGEKFRVEGCYGRMLVRELKEKLELSMGIPAHIIRSVTKLKVMANEKSILRSRLAPNQFY